MGKLFGTDGIRGIVGENLTAELAFRVGQAVTMVLKEKKGSAPLITIGMDTRISSDMLESALISGITSVGGDVMPLGVIPTPAVAYLTVKVEADAGVVISASHNPFEHNGIKVFNGQGYKLSDALEEQVEQKILSGDPMPIEKGSGIGKRIHGMKNLKYEYIKHLQSTVTDDLAGLRILVDCANGAAAATAPDLFSGFEIEADFIHRKPNGVNINDHCGSTHLDSLAAMVTAGGYDLGVAFDGDADRCLGCDEKGQEMDGDKIIALLAMTMKEKGRLDGDTAVVTVMSNLGFIKYMESQGINTEKTAVGDRYVLENMRENGFAIGGEQSGHVILLHHATTGDGELTAGKLLKLLAESGKKMSELNGIYAQYPQVLVNVTANAAQKKAYKEDEVLAGFIENEQQKLMGMGRVLVRVSGTEPKIRVMVEGQDLDAIHRCADRIVDKINKRILGQ